MILVGSGMWVGCIFWVVSNLMSSFMLLIWCFFECLVFMCVKGGCLWKVICMVVRMWLLLINVLLMCIIKVMCWDK